ncbi:MAG: hypothetical protein K2X52_24510 [Mycobacteriaceae bacterium]|nr:hypothetical protein [Mycobacteriaceae bacterium]
MGSRVGIAAAGFLVVYGLLVGGAGNIPANATPAAGDGDGRSTESGQNGGAPSATRPGGRDQASPGTGSRGDKPDARKPRERRFGSGRVPHLKPQTEDDDKRNEGEPVDGEDGGGAETPPKEPPREEPPGEEDPDDCWPWPPGPQPPGNGGGAGPPIRPPAGRPHAPPMQLPPHLLPEHTPSQPGVVDAEPGVGIAAPQLPVAPIALPIVVAPPVALPGGAAPRGPAAEPPAGRQAPPAETVSNAQPRHTARGTPNTCATRGFHRLPSWRHPASPAWCFSPVSVASSVTDRQRRGTRYAPEAPQDLWTELTGNRCFGGPNSA